MKMVMWPAVESQRMEQMIAAAGSMALINCESPDEALREIEDADAFFGKITPELLAAAEQLRWIQSPTASLEHYVFEELVQHPCTLTNMRGLFSDVIADHVFGYILTFARNLHYYLREQSHGRWSPRGGEQARSNFHSGPGLVSDMDRAHQHMSDLTLGIVGLGHIGREIARRADAFGMQIIAVDPRPAEVPECVHSLQQLDQLPNLLSESDYVVIAAPHTPQTAGMFRQLQFEQMKPSSYLINIGRGAIVSLDDLVQALQQQQIAGAALDVFEQEPLPPNHPLWAMPNVIITPHVAACSVRIAERHLKVLCDNIRRFVEEQPLRNIADKEQWF